MKCKKSIMSVNCGEKKKKLKKTVRSVIPFLSKLNVGCHNWTTYAFFVTKCLPKVIVCYARGNQYNNRFDDSLVRQ